MDYFSVDEILRLDAVSAFRRCLEYRNVRVARWFLRIAAVMSALVWIPSTLDGSYIHLALCIANLVFILALLRIFRRLAAPNRASLKTHLSLLDSSEEFVGRSTQAFVLTFLIAQFLTGVALISVREPLGAWIIVFAYAVIVFRFLVAETLLLYGTFLVVALVTPLISDADLRGIMWGGAGTNTAVALLVSLFITHRVRMSFAAEWNRDQRRAREDYRIREEVAFAREVQLSMLPQSVPAVSWLDIAATSVPATEVGGDYYDYFPLDDSRFAIVSADVAGHGLASGLVLSGVRSSLHLLSDDLGDQSRVLSRMNQMVRETSRHRMFVTLALLMIDQRRRIATVASAGHPPILLRRAGDGISSIEINSLPLGTRAPREYESREVPFGPGDLFVLHTDGVYETVNGTGETYGLDRLSSAILQANGEDAAAVLRSILSDLERFTGGERYADDVTIVVARVTS